VRAHLARCGARTALLAYAAAACAAARGGAVGARGARPATMLGGADAAALPVRVERVVLRSPAHPPLALTVLRDDETVLPATGALVRGNKARKFAQLPTDKPLASYGGAQSNAAAALAALARARRVPFDYFVNGPIPAHLRAAPTGNLAALLARGARVVELSRESGEYAALRAYAEGGAGTRPDALRPDARLIAQGGACAHAESGCAQLAAAIDAAAGEASASRGARTVALVCAGTGATALFAARHVRAATVVALPCAMDAAALATELRALDARSGRLGRLPSVFDCGPEKAVRFGALEPRVLEAWRLARAAGLEEDLVYGAAGLAQLLAAGGGLAELLRADGDGRPVELLWVHTGGLEGVPSQLARYVRKGLATAEELEGARARTLALGLGAEDACDAS
jgi:1-aminocyclopropane-1-carboxylate deaminase/D-cysteine desulfhydrase-like pyridoxal-dependent ACC family enzyme